MNILNDLKYTFAILKKNFAFTALCVSVIAVGLAIVLPLYSMESNSSLKSIPLPNGDQYVAIRKIMTGQSASLGYSEYDTFQYNYFKDNAKSFKTLEAWSNTNSAINDGTISEAYNSAEISAELLAATGQQAILGRIINTEDSQTNAEPVVLISFNVWQDYFIGRDDIIGHQSRINGQVKTIIGVMPEGFNFPVRHHLWLPIHLSETPNPGSEATNLIVVGILNDETTINNANNEIEALHTQLNTNWPEDYDAKVTSIVVPYINIYTGVRGGISASLGLIITFSIMFLVAFNVSNLFLASGDERIQELSIRSALGATPARVAQALLLESFIICIIGVTFGLILSSITIPYVYIQNLDNAPELTQAFWMDMTLNLDYILISLTATFIIWAISGGSIAWQISRSDLNTLINTGGKGLSSRSSSRLSKLLVNFQLIFSCIISSVAVILTIVGSWEESTTTFDNTNLYTGRIDISNTFSNNQQLNIAYQNALQQTLINQDGIAEVSISTALPGYRGEGVFYNIEDQDLAVDEIYPRQYLISISNNYFNLFETRLRQGRGFSIEDSQDSLPVAIIDQRMVDKYWPDQSAIGKRIQVRPEQNSEWLTIVGVSDVLFQESMLLPGMPGISVIYRPIQQTLPSQFSVIVKSTQQNFEFRQILRSAASQANRDIPLDNIRALLEMEESQIKARSARKNLILSLVLISIYLSAAAIYGLAARLVNRQRTNTGVRMALGASNFDTLAVFIKAGFRTVLIGLSIGGTLGILICYAILSSSSAEINTFQALVPTVLSICLIMGIVIMLANYIPARKIIKMEPGDALRHE